MFRIRLHGRGGHGIKNAGTTDLKFVAFLYQSS